MQRSTIDPHESAVAIVGSTTAFCTVLLSQNGPAPDVAGLLSIRQMLTEAILQEQKLLPGDVVRQSDAGAELAAASLTEGTFLKMCSQTSELIQSDKLITIRADG